MFRKVHDHAKLFGAIMLAAWVSCAAFIATAVADADAGAFLKGQTVRFYVGSTPGGSTDFYARALAPHFERRTGATVVVENRPGGSGLSALNQLVRVEPDGLSMMMLGGDSAVLAQLTKQAGVAFDMTTVSLLGRVTAEPHLFLVRPGLASSLEELVAAGHKLKISASGRVDTLGDYAAATCEALRIECQIITGYKGSKEAGLAVMNGEVDALVPSEGSGLQYAQDGRTKVIAVVGHERSTFLPDVPTVYEAVNISPEQRWWLDFRLSINDVGRVVVGPPGLPEDRLQYLQQVWREILTDPAVIEEVQRTQRTIKYLEPAELDKIVREVLQNLAPDKLEEVQEVLLRKYS